MSSRSVLGARILGWSMVVLGVGHLSTVAVEVGAGLDPASERALASLSEVAVAMPGPQRGLDQLYWGSSLMMAVMVIGFGLVVLWAAKKAPDSLRSLLWLGGTVALAALIVSAVLLPIVPIIGLSIAVLGAILGLADRADRAGPGLTAGR